MLVSDPERPHGFRAKIADFGLSRVLDVQSRMQTRMYGTVRFYPAVSLTTLEPPKPTWCVRTCG